MDRWCICESDRCTADRWAGRCRARNLSLILEKATVRLRRAGWKVQSRPIWRESFFSQFEFAFPVQLIKAQLSIHASAIFPWSLRLLFCDPLVGSSLEKIERKRSAIEHLVVEGADVKFWSQFFLGTVA